MNNRKCGKNEKDNVQNYKYLTKDVNINDIGYYLNFFFETDSCVRCDRYKLYWNFNKGYK